MNWGPIEKQMIRQAIVLLQQFIQKALDSNIEDENVKDVLTKVNQSTDELFDLFLK